MGGLWFFDGFVEWLFLYFRRGEKIFVVKGFVVNFFFFGMWLMEFFFYIMVGCEGFVDIVVKIVEIGYMFCCFMKVLEDLLF